MSNLIEPNLSSVVLPARANRRQLLVRAGLVGAAAMGASLMGNKRQTDAEAAFTFKGTSGKGFKGNAYDILNFALNLEYLESEFYLRAYTGQGLSASDTSGVGTTGTVTGGAVVPFENTATGNIIRNYAGEVAVDELNHVRTLRSVLGARAVAEPTLNFTDAFTAAAIAAGVIPAGETFDPFANQYNFLLGSFVFEDVGVTAYHGGAAYLSGAYLSDAAGILAVEAYHAGTIRSSLYSLGQTTPSLITAANAISKLRNEASNAASASETQNTDQGITNADGSANIVPADYTTSIAFARTFQQVLNIVYLNASPTLKVGGFFPNGLNGRIA